MKCSSIMTTPPTRVYVDSTIRETIKVLLEHHMYNVPVVERNEVFVGEISSRRLIGLMLPPSVSTERGLATVGFMRETLEDLVERYDRASDEPIANYMATDIEVVYPDSPLMDALALLYHKYIRIAVVDRETRQLVGGISFTTLLRAMEALDDRIMGG